MPWLFLALLEPVFYALSNVIDNHFVNHLFKENNTLIFYTSLTNLLFLPIIFLVEWPAWIHLAELPYFVILGLTGIVYLYPYYKALETQDTSVVVSLFSLGKIFVPVLAFLLVGEVLQPTQYLGFFIIIFGATLLSLNGTKKLRPNTAFLWMSLCTFILAFEAVIYKYIFTLMSWSTGFFWSTIFSFFFAFLLLLVPKYRRDIQIEFGSFKKHFRLFALEELLNFAGAATYTLAISLASVTLVSAVTSFQPVIVLLYALILGPWFPKAFKEDVTAKSLFKKLILFLIMILGVTIILLNGG